jgi:hypothetical protein
MSCILIKEGGEIVMAGPKKSEVSKAAADLAKSNTSARQKSEASETLNYAKASKPKPSKK